MHACIAAMSFLYIFSLTAVILNLTYVELTPWYSSHEAYCMSKGKRLGTGQRVIQVGRNFLLLGNALSVY